MRTKLAALLFAVSVTVPTALAGPRADHWSGFDFTAGMPFPSVVGLMLGFNVGDEARISTGVGTFVHWTTYTLDTKVFLGEVSHWAGYFGAGLSFMSGERGQVAIWDFQFDHAIVPYFEGGIDFQSDMGVHVTFNLAGSAPNGRVIVLPGLAIGWYF